MNWMKNLPNQLTVSRIVLISVFVLLANIDASKINFVYISPAVSHTCHVIAYIIAIIAGITDWFDGYLARKYKCESDFGRLMDLGFLQQSDDGVRHFFFANDDLHERCRAYLREHCAEAYLHYYDDEGRLRPEFRATDEASALYNRDIGFYEKALLDKMYTEHYDFRRASIADSDGLIRLSPTRD